MAVRFTRDARDLHGGQDAVAVHAKLRDANVRLLASSQRSSIAGIVLC